MGIREELIAHIQKLRLQYGDHSEGEKEPAAYFYIGRHEEVAAGVWHFYGLGNSTTFICDGCLLQVDTHMPDEASAILTELRAITALPFDMVCITHGHTDHSLGTWFYVEDNLKKSHPRPKIVGHTNLKHRFDKYQRLKGHQTATDRMQFQHDFDQPDLFVYPDLEFSDSLQVLVGGQTFEIVFGHGHTDDSIWVYNHDRKVLCPGDLFQWTAPNVGNPYKAPRFALENARALETMSALSAEVLCPGHGAVIHGQQEIETCLLTTARYLRTIQEHVETSLNNGLYLEETVNTLKLPTALSASKWLPPVYGHPQFIARSIYHRYAGYYSGNPAELFPPIYADAAGEVVGLAGSAKRVLDRARELHDQGNIALACQLAEWVIKAAPVNNTGWELYGLLFKQRAEEEVNMQARGAYNQAVKAALVALDALAANKTEPSSSR